MSLKADIISQPHYLIFFSCDTLFTFTLPQTRVFNISLFFPFSFLLCPTGWKPFARCRYEYQDRRLWFQQRVYRGKQAGHVLWQPPLCCPWALSRQEVRRTWSGCVELGGDSLHIGQRLPTIWRTEPESKREEGRVKLARGFTEGFRQTVWWQTSCMLIIFTFWLGARMHDTLFLLPSHRSLESVFWGGSTGFPSICLQTARIYWRNSLFSTRPKEAV